MIPVRCVDCGVWLDDEVAHLAHDPNECRRFLDGYCACDLWRCSDCCPDSTCVTPLARLMQVAQEQHRRAVDAATEVMS